MQTQKNKEKTHVKPKHAQSASGVVSTNEVPLVESFIRENDTKAVKNNHNTHKIEKERSELEKIEDMCQQFGVPGPSELYIVPRDFETSGKPNLTQFSSKIPEELARWIDEAEFEYTIGKINSLFAKAEEVNCRTVWSGFCKFLTCFVVRACQRTRTERAIIRVKNFVLQQNQDIYHPKGIHIVEPAARGLRHIEFRSITYYSMKYFLDHEGKVGPSETEFHVGKHHTQFV